MEIYVVGGAVRNVLMGLPVNDMDYVVVGATVKQMLDQGFTQVGADFPVFLHPRTGDEYALARTERKSGTGYHGFTVDASPEVTLEDDLRRRDLTINAMAIPVHAWPLLDDGNEMTPWDVIDEHLIDPFNGLRDLELKTIRPVQLDTFIEDPLRVVRAARFAATYQMTWSREMYVAGAHIVKSGELKTLSAERYALEIEKTLRGCDTAGQLALFVMHMEMMGLMKGGARVLEKMNDPERSLGAKVARLFCGYHHTDIDELASDFCLPTTLVKQAKLMYDIELAQYYCTRPSKHIGGVERSVMELHQLVETLRKAPAGAGFDFVKDWADDEHAPQCAKELWRRIEQMNGLFETIRYETHVPKDLRGNFIQEYLKKARRAEMVKLYQENPA